MVTVKELKPYHIKVDKDYVHVILAYNYFAVCVDEEVYEFVPVKAKEIKVDRKTKRIKNMGDTFAFQKGKSIIQFTMADLIYLPEFLIQLHTIAGPYYIGDENKTAIDTNMDNQAIMDELEQQNIKRLIDKALDENDEDAFYSLVKLL
ncbi:IDEAL domain-containing protein [Lentibacillus sp. Marseille-P4043]|uniref:IDEAL domain-containing protein n=1 Tax=Lentibacillus sp. Marseille-P4043 TaxID=2040293 RepID=UPI000D0AE4BF|nr:IDEAL domain-containing protein [Lentibacillus sp. Marseille-P4043]